MNVYLKKKKQTKKKTMWTHCSCIWKKYSIYSDESLSNKICFQISSCALSMFSPFLLQGCPFIRPGDPSEIRDWCGQSSYSKVTQTV